MTMDYQKNKYQPQRIVLWFLAGSFSGVLGGLLLLVVLVGALSMTWWSTWNSLSSSPSSATYTSFSGPGGMGQYADEQYSFVSGGTDLSTATRVWTGPRNQAVVNAALYVVSGLYNGGVDGYDTVYDAAQIPLAIRYWQQTCSGCAAWQQGQLQCVMLATAAFGIADQFGSGNQALPYVGNAITFWSSGNYAHQPGWAILPPTALPYPGDIVVFSSSYFDGVGHLGIIVDVSPPTGSQPQGYVQFAEANGPSRIVQMPFRQQQGTYQMGIWSGYTVVAYIRHWIDLSPST